MPAFKLTTTLFESRKLDTKWESFLKEGNHGIPELILTAENAREQIDCLKQAQKWIDKSLNIAMTDENVCTSLKFLVHLFFISTNKNPIRRVLVSYFQNLPDYVKTTVIGPSIKAELLASCDDSEIPTVHALYKDEAVNKQIQTNQELRQNVDTIAALIENFVLGEECVASISIETLNYLGKLQTQFYRTFRPLLSPVQKNETMHHCMETVKLANRICQRSTVVMETRLREPEMMVLYCDIVRRLVESDLNIIVNDEFLLDCKTTSAMNLCLLLKFTEIGDQLLNVLSVTAFKDCSMVNSFYSHTSLPDWLIELGLDRLSKAHLTSSAYLCLCYGVLSMVAIEILLQVHQGRCFMMDILLPELLDLSKKVSDVGSKLLASKALYFLTQRLRTYLTKTEVETVDVELCKRFKGDSSDMKCILEFIWSSWEDSVEAVRFTVKDIFENIVSIHQMVSQSITDDPFLDRLTVSILHEVNWSCKGKYGTLSVLVRHIGSTRMLELNTGIADQVLQQLEEQTLSCYVRDLYDELCTSHSKELTAGKQQKKFIQDGKQETDWSFWFDCWVEPVIKMLCQSTHMQKKHLIEYVLPKLLKTGDGTLFYMINTLTDRLHGRSDENSGQTHKGDQLGALIMCVRRARAMGLLKNKPNMKIKGVRGQPESENCVEKELLFGVLDVNLLKYALMIKDEQIRLDAFALLCESQKTTELISLTEIQLIQIFIPQNLTNQNPAFRQLLLSYLKKFISRMRDSVQVLTRQAMKNVTARDQILDYQIFLRWLTRCMFESLYPGSTFPRRTTALNALSLLLDTFNGTAEGFNFFNEVEISDIQCLLQCLTDSFEDNKMVAAKILISCFKQDNDTLHLALDKASDYLDLALTLAASSRPQDGMTGAYLLSVITHQPGIFDILKDKLSSQYSSSIGQGEQTGKDKDVDSDHQELPPFRKLLDRNGVREDDRRLLLLWILIKCLEDQVDVAEKNLLVAAATKPLYPTMLCIRYCLCDVPFRQIENQYHQCWSEFLSRFISLCLKISEIVSPVVHNCSPEGNIPVEAVSDISRQTNLPNITESEETVMLMPEYLTVCCWRSVKEISLILGQLTSDLPPLDMGSKPDVGFLSYSQILSIGEYFTTQLLESKHRGAFELAYAGFVKVTDMLWRSNIPGFHCLPKEWLSKVMGDIISDDPSSRLCATRRSAGIPFYIEAIVSTEPSSTGRVCFKDTMMTLIKLAFSETSVENCKPKVHALNILRMLYKDSKLKDDVTPYLADGLKVAILGFKSNLWAVRNAATLLMAAMMNRTFGVKRSKDESSLSRKNCQTGKTFFYKYPTLYQFLLDELSEATENIGTQLHPGLYPILMVLGRLFPSTMEGTDTTLNLAAFIPFVIRCCSSPVLKTRMMAARALQPLVEKDQVINVFSDLLTLLPHSQEDVIGQNQIHGVSLQLKYLLKTVSMLSRAITVTLKEVVSAAWTDRMEYLVSRANPCLATRTCALEISADILEKFGDDPVIQKALWTILQAEIDDLSGTLGYSMSTPCLSEFMSTVCELYIQYVCTCNSEGTESCTHGDSKITDQNQFGIFDADHKFVSDSKCCGDTYLEDKNNTTDVSTKHGTVEDAFMNFLSSRSYEVRRSFLRKVTEVYLNGRRESVGATTDIPFDSNGRESLYPKQKVDLFDGNIPKRYLDLFAWSGKFYKMLLEVCLTETNTECQVELFRLLQAYSTMTARREVDPDICRLHVNLTAEWIHRLEQTSLSEEVMSSCIEYLGTSFLSLCTDDSVGGVNHTDDTTDDMPLNLLEKFITILHNLSSAAESAVSIQLACANAILAISKCDILLRQLRGGVKQVGWSEGGAKRHCGIESRARVTDELEGDGLDSDVKIIDESKLADRSESDTQVNDGLKTKVRVSTECIENFYKTVFDLLQVDDLEVKETISDLMQVLFVEWKQGSPQSYICTSLLLNNWVRTSPDVSLVTSSLLQLIIESQDQEERGDERLFDRGEMNTFRDEIDFIQILDKVMMKILLGDKFVHDSDVSENLEESHRVNKATNFSCDRRLSDTLLPVIEKSIPPKILQCTSHDVFMDCSKHQEHALQVTRVLLLTKYRFILVLGTRYCNSVLDMWTKFKSSLDLTVLPANILKQVAYLCNLESVMQGNIDL